MTAKALARHEKIHVNRSQLRQHQSALLKKAKGRTVVVVTARDAEDEKCVVDRQYFRELTEKLEAAIETLEITTDTRLFSQILKAAATVDNDIRLGRLRSFEEAFGQD